MAATKGMSAIRGFIGPSPPSAAAGGYVDRQMVLNNPSVWQFTHAGKSKVGATAE
jgi:hypothetical protein